MVSMEAVSAMMAEFQRMNAENMSAILTKMLGEQEQPPRRLDGLSRDWEADDLQG